MTRHAETGCAARGGPAAQSVPHLFTPTPSWRQRRRRARLLLRPAPWRVRLPRPARTGACAGIQAGGQSGAIETRSARACRPCGPGGGQRLAGSAVVRTAFPERKLTGDVSGNRHDQTRASVTVKCGKCGLQVTLKWSSRRRQTAAKPPSNCPDMAIAHPHMSAHRTPGMTGRRKAFLARLAHPDDTHNTHIKNRLRPVAMWDRCPP